MQQYKTIIIQQKTPNSKVFHLYLNRPSRLNSFSYDFFAEFPAALSSLEENPNVGVIVLSGAGNNFSAGLDIEVVNLVIKKGFSGERGRGSEWLRREIKVFQDAVTAIERCRKPVIASIHGYCIAGALALVAACDIRFCTRDSVFLLKEIDFAIVSDIGTLQRLPSIIGYGNTKELALTGRKFSGQDAMDMGLVSRVFESKQALDEGVLLVAEGIGAKSPLTIAGIKEVMLRSKDMTLDQGLDYVATWAAGLMRGSGLIFSVIILLIAACLQQATSHGVQPLSRVAIHQTTFSLDDNAYIKASPTLLGSKGQNSEWVTVEYTSPNPSSDDWIGVFSPANFSASTCAPGSSAPKVLPPFLCSAPIKYQYANYSTKDYKNTGKGSLRLQLINQRSDFSFALFSGGIANPKLVAVSNSISFANPNAPVYPRLAQGKIWNEMTVTWTSGYGISEAEPFVEWGAKGGGRTRSPAGTLTISRNSMCGRYLSFITEN